MSIATAISRLLSLRNRLRSKINSLGIDSDTQLDLDDCVGAVERIGGTQEITQASVQYNVADKQYARVTDSNLVPGNIVSGVSILGVAGTASVSPPSARLTQGVAIYGNEDVPASMYPPNGYDGFSSVVFRQDDIVGNRMLVSTNIKSGVRIMGVNGTYETPTETKAPTLAELVTDGITSHSVAVTPSSGKHLSQVTIPRIVKGDGTEITANDIKAGVSILGIQGVLDYNDQITIGSIEIQDDNELTIYSDRGGHLMSAVIFRDPSALNNDHTVVFFSILRIVNPNMNMSIALSGTNKTMVYDYSFNYGQSNHLYIHLNDDKSKFDGTYYYAIARSNLLP